MPEDPPANTPAETSLPTRVLDPAITRSLITDYDALKNDLEQAVEFSEELQKEVAVSKNDAAHFRQMFEKAARDLERLQESIVALRKERHDFANEVMMTRGLVIERDAQIAKLTMETVMLKNSIRHAEESKVAEIAAKNREAAFLQRFSN